MESNDSEENNNPQRNRHQSQTRLYITQAKFLLVLTYICLGCFKYVPGPTLIDLSVQVREKLPDLPLIFTARGAGYVLGCIVGALILQVLSFFQRALLMFLLMVLLSASLFSITQIRNIDMLYTVFFASGVWMSGMVVGVNDIRLNLCLEPETSFYKTLAAFYSLGSLSAPFLARGYVENKANRTVLHMASFVNSYHSSILFVYIFVCVVTLLVSLLWLANYCFMSINKIEVQLTPTISKEDLNPTLKFFVIISASILFFISTTIHFSLVQLLPMYGTLAFNMTQYETCDLLILFHGFHALGSISLLLLPKTIKPHNLQIAGIALVFCGAILMYLYTDVHLASFWGGHAFLGLGSSYLIPTLLAWMNTRMQLHDSEILPLFLMGAFSEMIVPTAMAHYIFSYATLTTAYLFVTALYAVFLLLHFFWMHLLHTEQQAKKTNGAQELSSRESIIRRYLRRLSQEMSLPFFKTKKTPKVEVEPEPVDIFSYISEAQRRVRFQNTDLLESLRQMEYSSNVPFSQLETSLGGIKEDERRSIKEKEFSSLESSKSEQNLSESSENEENSARQVDSSPVSSKPHINSGEKN